MMKIYRIRLQYFTTIIRIILQYLKALKFHNYIVANIFHFCLIVPI